MKATLKFKLPKEEYEYLAAIKAGNMQSALHDILEMLRHKVKYEEASLEVIEIQDRVLSIINNNELCEVLDK